MNVYIVKVFHHDKDWVGGDLEDKFELEDSDIFKTRKAAKAWILNDLSKKRGTKTTKWHVGDKPSYAYCYTGVKWQHENSGEEMEEYWMYTLVRRVLK